MPRPFSWRLLKADARIILVSFPDPKLCRFFNMWTGNCVQLCLLQQETKHRDEFSRCDKYRSLKMAFDQSDGRFLYRKFRSSPDDIRVCFFKDAVGITFGTQVRNTLFRHAGWPAIDEKLPLQFGQSNVPR